MSTQLYAAVPGPAANISGNTADVWETHFAMLPGGRSAVVWTDDANAGIFLRFVDAEGQPEGDLPIRVTPNGALANRASVALLENGNLIVTYTSLSTFSTADIRAQIITPQGALVLSEPVFIAEAGSTSVSPETIALANGGFVTIFNSLGGDGDAFGVMAQVTDADLTPVGDTFVVNQTTESFQSDGVAMQLADGGFAVVWRAREVDNSSYAVVMRLFDADGTPRSSEYRVSQKMSGAQTNPDITLLADGRYVVTWESEGQDLSGYGIYARIYSATGIPETGEFQVNTRVQNDQRGSDVTATPDGGFVVSWYNSLGGALTEIRSQRFDSAGQPVGGEILLAGGPDDLNLYSDIEFADDGSGRLMWFSLEQGDPDGTVYIAKLNSLFQGSEAYDTLEGSAGDDTLFGFAGDDTLVGGAGNDVLDGGAGSDTASYASATGAVSVYLSFGGRDVGGGAGADAYVSIENLAGSSFNDRLIGDSISNLLDGGAGNDVLKGKGGDDIFIGGTGNDTMRGGDGVDVMQGDGGWDVMVALAGDDMLTGGNGRDFLYGGRDADTLVGGYGDDELRGNIGNDTLRGGQGADDLRGGGSRDDLDGGADNDFLYGGGSTDTLHGGAGDDSLTGGFGNGVFDGVTDTFAFGASAQGSGGFDRIKDYEDGIDLLDLSSFGFTDFDTDVAPLASDRTGGLRLDLGNGDVVFIEALRAVNFDASDVILT